MIDMHHIPSAPLRRLTRALLLLGATVLGGVHIPARGAGAQAPMQNVVGVTMERAASGTTWIPDAVALPSYHRMTSRWTVMLHGYVFGQYNTQRGNRGDDQWGSLNWGMLMATRNVGRGQLQLRTMVSVDPATVSGRGYPLLLQTGESYEGESLRDRQHPHDFWMELAALYERPITRGIAAQVYVAPAGEPALGPVAYMHRPSAVNDPIAPLGHHWQDATHITFGVATVGVFTRTWKLEASAFNGEEPDDRRWNIDLRALDSYSARLTVNPNANWSFTAGTGRIKPADITGLDHHITRRTVFSALHSAYVGGHTRIASAVIAGFNAPEVHGKPSRSLLAESGVTLPGGHTIFARVERTQRTVAELGMTDELALYNPEYLFTLHSASLGYSRDVARWRALGFALGARGTVNVVPGGLEETYGSRTPVGVVGFVKVGPVN